MARSFLIPLALALCLAGCDGSGPDPFVAEGRWVGSRTLDFDVPFVGEACGVEFSDARRLTSGTVRLSLVIDKQGQAVSNSEIFYTVVTRQAGLPDCEGGNRAAGIATVGVSRVGDHLTINGLFAVRRAEFDLSATALTGSLTFSQYDAGSHGFGGVDSVPFVATRV
ncbi:hypothetical protein [Rubrivirga sp.]|uniref:hypothetical protein n=1 Tax=Rubrivirga sp. TaxID=1885344 RepID=UPI003B526853